MDGVTTLSGGSTPADAMVHAKGVDLGSSAAAMVCDVEANLPSPPDHWRRNRAQLRVILRLRGAPLSRVDKGRIRVRNNQMGII